MKSKAKKKPCLPDSRPHNYFNIKDEVRVYIDGKWEHGVVVSGYRHHDGCVSYILDNIPESRPDKKGPWGCGKSVPTVIKEWEYQHFADNPGDYQKFLDLSDREYNGTILVNDEMRTSIE